MDQRIVEIIAENDYKNFIQYVLHFLSKCEYAPDGSAFIKKSAIDNFKKKVTTDFSMLSNAEKVNYLSNSRKILLLVAGFYKNYENKKKNKGVEH